MMSSFMRFLYHILININSLSLIYELCVILLKMPKPYYILVNHEVISKKKVYNKHRHKLKELDVRH